MNPPLLPARKTIVDDVRRALDEDVGSGDVTAALVPAGVSSAQLITRDPGILCGTAWFDAVFEQLDSNVKVSWHFKDGERFVTNDVLCELDGSSRSILTGERTALNFLQTLSATASATRLFVDRIAGTSTRILDTRKTIPGLRRAQKYAVACGGGMNHRMGLYDAILIKENHISASGSIASALAQARKTGNLPIEVEVENLAQLREALAAGADRVLLDNFAIDDLRTAARETNGRARLEASGGVTIDNVRDIAETGVDFISIGALTKNLRAIDLSLRFNDL